MPSACLVLVAAALALPEFPALVQDELALGCAPPCAVCHDGSPGSATAVQPFVQALEERGFLGTEESLPGALSALADDAVDSDGDGAPDVDELEAGTDPNPGGVAFCEATAPHYGCLSSAGRPPRALAALLAGFGLVAFSRGRR